MGIPRTGKSAFKTITCLTESGFALMLQSGLPVDKEVQGSRLGWQDHQRYENNVAIFSACTFLPHLQYFWDFSFPTEAGIGCLAALPMDPSLQLLNSQCLGRAPACRPPPWPGNLEAKPNQALRRRFGKLAADRTCSSNRRQRRVW